LQEKETESSFAFSLFHKQPKRLEASKLFFSLLANCCKTISKNILFIPP